MAVIWLVENVLYGSGGLFKREIETFQGKDVAFATRKVIFLESG